MIPLNVTHTAIFTPAHMQRLDPARTPLRHTLSTLLSFFAHAYRDVFGFADGPPLHDALTIAYLARPELFKSRRQHVDVELRGEHSAGETVVDVWDYRRSDDSWGKTGRNCVVAEAVDVRTGLLLRARLTRADAGRRLTASSTCFSTAWPPAMRCRRSTSSSDMPRAAQAVTELK